MSTGLNLFTYQYFSPSSGLPFVVGRYQDRDISKPKEVIMVGLSWTEEFFVLFTTLKLSKPEVGLVVEDPLNVPPVLLGLTPCSLLTFTLRFPSH